MTCIPFTFAQNPIWRNGLSHNALVQNWFGRGCVETDYTSATLTRIFLNISFGSFEMWLFAC